VAFEFDGDKVSFHAVTRYVQRILGVSLPPIEPVVAWQDAERHAAATGLTVIEIKRRLYTPAAAAAIELGFREACVGNVHMMFRSGVITTVVRRVLPKPPTNIRPMTRGEARRGIEQLNRRQEAARRSAPPTKGEAP
jgi:hypothetical protein